MRAESRTLLRRLVASWQPPPAIGGARDFCEQCLTATRSQCRLAVSRYQCRSDLYEMDLMLDVNIEVYPLKVRRSVSAEGE